MIVRVDVGVESMRALTPSLRVRMSAATPERPVVNMKSTSWLGAATSNPAVPSGNSSSPAVTAATSMGSSRSEAHTSELQSLMRISYAVFCLKKKQTTTDTHEQDNKTDD